MQASQVFTCSEAFREENHGPFNGVRYAKLDRLRQPLHVIRSRSGFLQKTTGTIKSVHGSACQHPKQSTIIVSKGYPCPLCCKELCAERFVKIEPDDVVEMVKSCVLLSHFSGIAIEHVNGYAVGCIHAFGIRRRIFRSN